MDLRVSTSYEDRAAAEEAARIVQKCVHCGFCNATCPTYQLLGDELDGPRGRIYLMKSMLEGNTVSSRTQLHLDRCLTCRSCESTCPSGVRYGRLLEIGRELAEQQVRRSSKDRLVRFALRKIMTSRKWFGLLSRIGRWVRPALPPVIAKTLPARRDAGRIPSIRHSRRMLLLDGCVQPALIPVINAAAARVLDRAGISVVVPPEAGCCGALSLHLGATAEAERYMRRNIDAWWPEIEKGCEAIVMTASGCGVTVREYGQLLARDRAYAEKAARISSLTRDLSEVVAVEKPGGLPSGNARRVAYHAPCTLQHGQKVHGQVEELLRRYGWQLATVREAHLCCGSAGSYSLLQPRIANRLLRNKLAVLQEDQPELIASANIGCLLHLGKEARLPVRHWIELLDPAIAQK